MPTDRIPLAGKNCTSCEVWKSVDFFSKNSRHKTGLQCWCKQCKKEYKLSNREKIAISNRLYREQNKDKVRAGIREWALRNPGKVLEKNRRSDAKRSAARNAFNRDLRRTNPEIFRDRAAIWRNANREKFRAIHRFHSALRKAIVKGQKIAETYKVEVSMFYKNVPSGLHVDHIVPLKGKDVCGLHVPWNLQYLSPTENRRKGNRHADD